MFTLTKIENAKKEQENNRFMFIEFNVVDDESQTFIGSMWIGWDDELKKLLFFIDRRSCDYDFTLTDEWGQPFKMTYDLDKCKRHDVSLQKIISDL